MLLKRSLDTLFQNINGKPFLVRINNTYEISESAVEIWKLLDGKHSLDDLLTELAAKYGCNPEEEREDVQAFLQFLVDKGLAVNIAQSKGGQSNE